MAICIDIDNTNEYMYIYIYVYVYIYIYIHAQYMYAKRMGMYTYTLYVYIPYGCVEVVQTFQEKRIAVHLPQAIQGPHSDRRCAQKSTGENGKSCRISGAFSDVSWGKTMETTWNNSQFWICSWINPLRQIWKQLSCQPVGWSINIQMGETSTCFNPVD